MSQDKFEEYVQKLRKCLARTKMKYESGLRPGARVNGQRQLNRLKQIERLESILRNI